MPFNFSVSIIILVVSFIWFLGLSFLLWQVKRNYHRLTSGMSKKDLLSVLDKIIKETADEQKKMLLLNKALEKIRKENTGHLQKIGLVRFNPFAGTGGDQSFCLALLDGEDSGLVLSSLHSRDATRIYAKPVKQGKSAGYELSHEEVQAIKNAKKIH
jgi:hypothetical protein